MKRETGKDYLTPQEVAELLMVAPVTVRSWALQGRLSSVTTPGGHRRFLRDEVERFAARRRVQPIVARTMRVLIVEDDAQLAGYLIELLGGVPESIETAYAPDGFEAGLQVQRFRPDVMLLDLMMPGIDGFEVCRRVKADSATQGTRVIAMTGHGGVENLRRILAAGAECCLLKPFSAAELLSAIGVGKRAAVAPT